ncbi:MAG: chemotaxis protein CheA [Bdellovibrionaceae bacterium]|jgi:two-component system, chemotaxis family, sensor kinase CheA|nr:chemotaxis protein CheA [Pseudobdellovibrionaceae bacterium]
MDDFEKELKGDFLEESAQLLEDCEQSFLQLENNHEDPEILDQIFRLAHNLKGSSRAVGFGEVAEFTHNMENLILQLKENRIPIVESVVSLLLDCNDHLSHMVSTLTNNFNAEFDSVDLISRIVNILENGVESSAQTSLDQEGDSEIEVNETLEEDAHDIFEQQAMVHDKSLVENTDIQIQLDKKQEVANDVQPPLNESNVVEINKVQNDEQTAPLKKKVSAVTSQAKKDENIRVSLSRLAQLNNSVGELVILQSVLNQHKDEFKSEILTKSLGQLSKLSKDIHEISMSLRMLPIKGVLQKMQRIVRDTSNVLNKDIELRLIGEETEVDKLVLEQLGDPLVHLVRNAVDHGIESNVEDRINAGKSAQGNIDINCFHDGNSLVIEVIDDGGGIPPDIIRKKAIEKNIIKANDKMSDQEVVQLVFHPGFSTKEQVSEVSGRGVGMDVVKTNIQQLSGDITVDSTLGKGSVFRIALPLSMAVIDGLIVEVGRQNFVFPLGQVHETINVRPEMLGFAEDLGVVLNLRGENMPLIKASDVLGTEPFNTSQSFKKAVIVKSKTVNYALLVDEVVDHQQIVVKPLGHEINYEGFMGSSILGNGLPALILDLFKAIKGKNLKIKKIEQVFNEVA